MKLTRREFLFGALGFSAGYAIASGAIFLIPGCVQKPVEEKKVQEQVEEKKVVYKIPKPPWKYEIVDPKEVGAVAYEAWYEGFCTYAVVKGVFEVLGKKVGEPYKSFPLEAIKWGHGGTIGWGTICGTLAGAGIVTGFILGEKGEKILNDVIYWYTVTELPQYIPKEPKAEIKNKSVSNSPLCHISVGRWMKKENVGFFTPQRKERCARLAADVAMKTVELLNEYKKGTYKPLYPVSQAKFHKLPAQNNCIDCHTKGTPKLPGT